MTSIPERAKPAAGGTDILPDMLKLLVRFQFSAAPVQIVLAVMFAAVNLSWNAFPEVSIWLAAVVGCHGIQLFFFRQYIRKAQPSFSVGEWTGIFAACEFLSAACWSITLVIFWDQNNAAQQIFLIGALMAVTAIRTMSSSYFLPVVTAGSGLITLAIAAICIWQGDPMHIGIGITAVIIQSFFVYLTRRLQKTAHDMLVFKSEREQLIEQLETARMQAEYARQRAEAANMAKSRFLATVSHELRTPLNAIMGFSEILSGELMGPIGVPVYREYSNDIHHSGNYLLSLVNDILDLSRLEAGKHKLEEEIVNVTHAGQDCLTLLSLKLSERKQNVEVKFPENLPLLLADQRAIRQIWMNFLSNAVKFSPAGSTITLEARMSLDNCMMISVTDNGPGISAEEAENIVDPFSRGQKASAQAIDGAGLGLSIVDGLAKLHGGRFDLQSTPGAGTTVSVVFPASRVVPKTESKPSDPHLSSVSPSQMRLIEMTA